MEIELCGYKVLIDDEDYEKINKYKYHKNITASKTVYFSRTINKGNGNRTATSLHRDIMCCKIGDGKVIDHISGDTLDCRKQNLRFVSMMQNAQNRRKLKTGNGLKGCTRWGNKYKACICANKKIIYLGLYKTETEAHAAYCEASKKYHGEYGRTE